MNRPPQRLRARSAGAAAHSVLERARSQGHQHGVVLGSFSHGHYVKFGATIFAVGQTLIDPGPLHLLYSGPVAELRHGSPITISTEQLWSSEVEIDLRRAARWDPPHLGRENVDASLQVLEQICDRHPPENIDLDWLAVERAAQNNDLDSLRLLLEGRGPGLTPVGDDVLAGVLLVHALHKPDDSRRDCIAEATATSDLSRGFLYWASRGQSIEPVHRMIRQASAGLDEAASQTAARIANVGASSGAALLFGIGLAARTIQRSKPPRSSHPFDVPQSVDDRSRTESPT